MVTMLAKPNKVTIFEDGAADLPFENPLAYLPLVKFDSTFRYLPFDPARIIDATINIPTTIGGGARGRIITLGPHGQSGVPFIVGFYRNASSLSRPLVGTVIVAGPNVTGGMVTWTLGVDGTDVFLAEERSFPGTIGVTLDLPVTVFISSRLAD